MQRPRCSMKPPKSARLRRPMGLSKSTAIRVISSVQSLRTHFHRCGQQQFAEPPHMPLWLLSCDLSETGLPLDDEFAISVTAFQEEITSQPTQRSERGKGLAPRLTSA